MAPGTHGDIWSLCDNPATHLLRGYEGGVYIHPEAPRTNDDINVKINGMLASDVTGGHVQIDLSIMNMIKIKKELDLCTVLQSDVMGHRPCTLSAGDVELEATAFIPREIPKLPLKGDIRINDQDGRTVTCIHLDFKLQ
ncbi:uncharacterized protein BYT42DRAFT_592116 [Radiomyces spectabilis]|uniref:uncharacterized protein n=1 Tax=Radiomyces spectabilis TaxID=64574 RepID=UPI00221F5BA5|nr:uncharacterized protein BYT42DRAFT_592116 [Radiomyces spectabilis]KAI8391776.1 hypothetical protein BYT42DRAFT_592116 [Radiomyces spectabilis]